MAGEIRYNKVIDLVEHGKPGFCSGLVWNGNLDDLTYVADADYDMVIVDDGVDAIVFCERGSSGPNGLVEIANRLRIESL